jgi:conjugal transfer pilus assembly protein TraF
MRQAVVFSAVALAASLSWGQPAPAPGAQPAAPAPAVRLDEDYGNAFLRYVPYSRPKAEEAKPVPPPAAPTPAPKPPEEKEQQVNVEWLRKNYPLLEQRAIDKPTKENLEALAYVRRVVLDKSQRFAEGLIEVTKQDPLLDENNRVPSASAGANAVQRANVLAQEAAVKELASTGGLFVFVDSRCRFCAMQLPILEILKRDTGMDAMVISIDGYVPKGYKGPVVRDNGMFQRLKLTLTPSIVYVDRPKAFRPGQADPNRYLIVSQGFYAADDLAKQIAYAGFRAGGLSAEVRRNLSIWDTGVATVDDLSALKLDVNDPASISRAIAPLLRSQYEQPLAGVAAGKR